MIGPGPAALDVSRETYDRLACLVDLLTKWTPRINLVSRGTLDQVWARHIRDSVQVFRAAPQIARTWADLGSGGGFPGLVVAILAAEAQPDLHVTLIESDQRKCAFLRTVLRDTGVAGTVLAQRIEAAAPQRADVLSARALAGLPTLLAFAERHLADGGTALFPKGATWQKEVTEARRQWQFDLEPVTSDTDPNAAILIVKGVSRV